MIVNDIDGQIESRQRLEDATSVPRRYGRLGQASLAVLALGLMAGCGASRPINYYQLTNPGAGAPATAQPLPVTIIVGLPAAPDLYRDNRVVYAVAIKKSVPTNTSAGSDHLHS